VVAGSESTGVSDEWREGSTRVAIAMHGRADSLDAAACAAVLLFGARGDGPGVMRVRRGRRRAVRWC
jgi:tRNA G18 (ribose-2'-O)-methylase SpoU